MALLVAACGSSQNDNTNGSGYKFNGNLDDVPALNSVEDTLAWAYGQILAAGLNEGFFSGLNHDLILLSAQHALAGNQGPLSTEQIRQSLNFIVAQNSMMQMRDESEKEANVDRMQEEYFANLVKNNPAVKSHPSGFYYEVVKNGTGSKAQYGQRVSFDYRSFLMLSGEPYDQTYGKRDPILHTIGSPMFQGLVEGMQLMNAGSIYRFYFPYQLAFGPQGSGDIPGYTPFIYEVEIHEIFRD